jgi:hypothetical protein
MWYFSHYKRGHHAFLDLLIPHLGFNFPRLASIFKIIFQFIPRGLAPAVFVFSF